MKHNILHGSTRNSDINRLSGSFNAAHTARLEYGGTRQAVAACCILPPFQPVRRLSEKMPLQTAFFFNDFDIVLILALPHIKVNIFFNEK